VSGNDRSPVTQLQVTACVFGSIYAFRLIAVGLAVCGLFTVLPLQGFEVTYPIFYDVPNTDWLTVMATRA